MIVIILLISFHYRYNLIAASYTLSREPSFRRSFTGEGNNTCVASPGRHIAAVITEMIFLFKFFIIPPYPVYVLVTPVSHYLSGYFTMYRLKLKAAKSHIKKASCPEAFLIFFILLRSLCILHFPGYRFRDL